MIRFRCAAPAVALLLLLLAACGDKPGAAKLTLRYHPPAGAEYRYALEQRNTMKMESGPLVGMGEQTLTMRMHFTQKVTGPVTGGVEVRLTFDSTHLEAPGVPADMMAREMDRVRGRQSTVLFDERGKVVRNDLGTAADIPPALATQMAAGVKAMAFQLPEGPVGPGDSWTVETELPLGQLPGASGSSAARTTLTVRGIQTTGGDTTVTLGVETTFPTEPIQLNMGGQAATLKLSGGLAGDQLFSLTRGAVVRTAMKGTMRMNVTGGMIGQKGMTVSSDTEMTLRLADGP